MEKNDYILFDEQVDRFLRHQMNAEEETKFKAQLANNEELRQRAHTIAMTIREMNAMQRQRDVALVESIKQMKEKDFRKAAGIKAKKVRLVPLFAKIAIAACLAGLAFFGTSRYMLHQNIVALGNTAYTAYVSDLSEYNGSRGVDAAAIIKQLEELFLQVKDSQKLETTISTLDAIYSKAQDEDSEYNEFIDDIAWNLAIAYLKTGERDKPLPLLEGMLKRNERYPDITEPVQKLINDIKGL